MDAKLVIALIAAKLSSFVCRWAGHPGTNLPGRVALKIDPSFLRGYSEKLRLIMVTGTNGKTTTTKMVSAVLDENGVKYIVNKSGANTTSGIASAIAKSVDIFGRTPVSVGLFEIDEAYFAKIAPVMKPDILIVTNFFRDQLDRYGEIFALVNRVKNGIRQSEKTKIILNADDSFCGYLGKDIPNEIKYYGVEEGASPNQVENFDEGASYCVFCQSKYRYSYRVYGHMGGYRCDSCGFQRPDADIRCLKVEQLAGTYSDFQVEAGGAVYPFRVNTPGLYNVYNALAAVAFADAMGFPVRKTIEALSKYENSFGRMENVAVQDRNIVLILSKNPAGFDQVLNYICARNGTVKMAVLINDNAADGHDVSWLWNISTEKLNSLSDRLAAVWVSGTRADDMAVRLKYTGISAEKIIICRK